MNQIVSIKELLNGKIEVNKEVTLKGWVRSKRDSKIGISFIMLNDGSSINSMQIIAENKLSNYNNILSLTKDCAIIVNGKIQQSIGKEQAIEVLASYIEIVGTIENPDVYPVAPKRHTVEYLREIAHLRVRTNLIATTMRIRNAVSMAIHNYLQDQGFFWIHTPIITSSDCEGAGELFKVTTLGLNNIPKVNNEKTDFKEDFFGKEAFLTVSGQLNVEAYCLALSKVYTFGPTFRAELSNTTRHLAEFWMIEPEIAFANLDDTILVAKNLLKHIFTTILNNHADEMDFFAKYINKDVITRLRHILDNDFEIITYTDAIKCLQTANIAFENKVEWGIDLASEHEKWLCEEYFKKPTIVINYPKGIKAFYMRLNDDNKTVAAMDILVPGVGEIIGGSEREDRYNVIMSRINELNIDPIHLKWYLDLRKYASIPHAGFGLGLERIISYITGVANIRDTIPFPRAYRSLHF